MNRRRFGTDLHASAAPHGRESGPDPEVCGLLVHRLQDQKRRAKGLGQVDRGADEGGPCGNGVVVAAAAAATVVLV